MEGVSPDVHACPPRRDPPEVGLKLPGLVGPGKQQGGEIVGLNPSSVTS